MTYLTTVAVASYSMMEDGSSCSSDGEEKAVGVEDGGGGITESESAPRYDKFMATDHKYHR